MRKQKRRAKLVSSQFLRRFDSCPLGVYSTQATGRYIVKLEEHGLMKRGLDMGKLLLALWLIASGLNAFFPVVQDLGPVLPLLALVAGILILVGR